MMVSALSVCLWPVARERTNGVVMKSKSNLFLLGNAFAWAIEGLHAATELRM